MEKQADLESTKDSKIYKRELADARNSSHIEEMNLASGDFTESSNSPPDGSTDIKQHPGMRMTRSVMLILGWVCIGLFSEITGPTLPYLKQRVDCNYEEISRVMVARSVGYLVGSLGGGLLCEWYAAYVDVWAAFSLTIAAIATAIVPWCTSLALMAALSCTDGLGKGILAAGGNAFMIRMWGLKAAVPVHALHTAFGIGALLAPQLVRPFIDTESEVINSAEHIENNTYPANTSNMTSNDLTTAAIEYPYSIIAVFTLFVATIFVFIHCFSPIRQEAPQKRSQLSAKNAFNPSSWLRGDKRLGYAVLTFSFIIFMLPVGMERAYGKFLFPLSVTGRLKLSPVDATLLESAFWASFTAGRLFVTLAATRVSQILLIVLEMSINVVATVALVAFGQISGHYLTIFSALFAAGMAPLYPSMLSWLNLYVEVTAMLTCMTFFSSACGAFVYSWMTGYLFQYEGPDSLLYFMVASTCACAMVFVALYLSAVKYEKGFHRRREI